jgi:CheY-like chemotaxis protein
MRFVKDKAKTVILIVEDEGLIALHMMEFLEREGYQVLEPVSSGEEAVERCGYHPRPDLIMMDVSLSGLIDGIMATNRIRERYQIPVIILTAHCDDKTGKMIKDLVPEGYLVKPSTPADILGTISLVLQSYAKKDVAKVLIVPYVDSPGLAGQ